MSTKPSLIESHNHDHPNRDFPREAFDTYPNAHRKNSMYVREENRFPINRLTPEITISNYSNVNNDNNTIRKRYDEYSKINSSDNLNNRPDSLQLTEMANEEETGAKPGRKRESLAKTSKKNDFSEV